MEKSLELARQASKSVKSYDFKTKLKMFILCDF